eukprot:g888.t1
MTAFSSRLMIGTSDGKLFVYAFRRRAPRRKGIGDDVAVVADAAASTESKDNLSESPPPSHASYALINTVKHFSQDRRAIRKLMAVEKWNVLLSISEECVAVHDLIDVKYREHLPRTRGCSDFCLDVVSMLLCVAVNTKLMLYIWDGSNFSGYKCFDMLESIRSVAWGEGAICVGFSKLYVLVDVDTGLVSREIFESGHARKRGGVSNVVRFGFGGNDAIDDNYRCRVSAPPRDVAGTGGERNEDDDNETNTAKTSSAKDDERRMRDNELLLVRDSTGIFVDGSGCPSREEGRSIAWSANPSLVHSAFPFVLGIVGDRVEVHNGTTTCGCRSIRASDVTVVASTVERRESDGGVLAVVLLGSANAVVRCEMISPQLQVEALIRTEGSRPTDAYFEEALSICSVSERQRRGAFVRSVDRSTRKTMHTRYARHLVRRGAFAEARGHFALDGESVLEVLSLFPDLLPETWRTRAGALEIARRLDCALEDSGARERRADRGGVVDLLIPYLEQERQARRSRRRRRVRRGRRRRRTATVEKGEDEKATGIFLSGLVDTVLAEAYYRTSPSNLVHFFRSPHRCWIDETASRLSASKCWEELVELYGSAGMHREALELMSGLAQDSSSSTTTTIERGSDNRHLVHMMEYLSGLGAKNEALLFEFARPVVVARWRLGLCIFTESRHTDGALNPKRVVEFLTTCSGAGGDGSAAANVNELVIAYLEHTIDIDSKIGRTLGTTDADLHYELISRYVDAATTATSAELGTRGGSVIASEIGTRRVLRERLLQFLVASKHYDAKRVLANFPQSELLEERAILLRRLGQHDRAFHIYVHKLKSPGLAERYCADVYRESGLDAARAVYLAYLRVYIRRPPTSKMTAADGLKAAMKVLQKYHMRMDPRQVLRLLPSTLSVAQLRPFLHTIFRYNDHELYSGHVQRNLLKYDNLLLMEEKLGFQSKSVRVGYSTECVAPGCAKKIGLENFSCRPDGSEPIHAGCLSTAAAAKGERAE